MTERLEISPADQHNRALIGNVHPPDWVNPTPEGRYNLVVIGGGTAGLVTAAGAAGLGAKVAIVERDLLGGDCLNVGCVPSKSLIRAAQAWVDVRDAGRFGVRGPENAELDFGIVMERMRRLRAGLSGHDSAARFKSLGVNVYLGAGHFTGPGVLEVGGQQLRFRRAVIATGARATRPPISGLAEAGFLTNENVFNLTELPRRLLVLGAGPIGCELAQAFARFGSQVTLIGKEPMLLPREDADAAKLLAAALARDGVHFLPNSQVNSVRATGSEKIASLASGQEITADAILAAVGRTPNLEGLGLAEAGVAFDAHGVSVNDQLRTTNSRIYAAGDVCSRFKFTHAADAMARIAIQNALFYGRAKANDLIIPWCTYTDPEIAHVGLSEREATEKNVAIDTFVQEMAEVDRAVLDGDEEGFVKVHVAKGTDRIVGATVVARHAADFIAELTLAMTGGLGLKTLSRTIHPYPTQIEALRKVADRYNRTRLTPFVSRWMERWFRWCR